MSRTVEAVIDESGSVRLLHPVEISGSHRALVTILDELPLSGDDIHSQRAAAMIKARAFQERMAEKYGQMDDSTEIIREARDNPRV